MSPILAFPEPKAKEILFFHKAACPCNPYNSPSVFFFPRPFLVGFGVVVCFFFFTFLPDLSPFSSLTSGKIVETYNRKATVLQPESRSQVLYISQYCVFIIGVFLQLNGSVNIFGLRVTK